MNKFIFYPLGLGFILAIIGLLTGSNLIIVIGALGFIPITLTFGLAAVGFFWTMIDNIIPNFKGKDYFVGIIVFLFVVFWLTVIFTSNDHIPNPCRGYRGLPC